LAKSLSCVIAVAPPGEREADAVSMMHPFRVEPDAIDAVACERCGHPAWEHCVGEVCAECERQNGRSTCKGFFLAEFAEVTIHAFEEHLLGY